MLNGIEIMCHSSIKIKKDKIIYVDPFKINVEYNDADIIFVTHSHYDHFSKEDIIKVKNNNTKIVITEDLQKKVAKMGFEDDKIFVVKPNNEYIVDSIQFQTIPAYNINKNFHPKENNWVGYAICINGISYYIAGDTDVTEENSNIRCDVAFVPVGGTYTMTYKEAANLINIIKPKIAVPIHYGDIVGEKEDGEKFKEILDTNIMCKIMIKQN